MKKVVLLFGLIVLFTVASNAQISVPLPQKKSQKEIINPIEADAMHNLDVAYQYFIKKRHIGALERSSEAIVAVESGGIQFAKMDALLYYAGMSSYYLATGRGKQKIDLTKLSEDNKRKYAPEKLREDAIAYLSTLVEKYPQSKHKEDAAKALKELESAGAATK
jgi:hypothetical protein